MRLNRISSGSEYKNTIMVEVAQMVINSAARMNCEIISPSSGMSSYAIFDIVTIRTQSEVHTSKSCRFPKQECSYGLG